ncbi:hypothetical protein LguiA_002495 [Lonicera macranthoides]
MASFKRFSFPHVYYYIFVLVCISIAKAQAQSMNRSLYTFGDSFVDPGNNNYISTVARANFLPYGRDFMNGMPTGRFSNGRQVPDFIAMNLSTGNFPQAFLDPNLTMADAVGFGSAGTGFDPVTPTILNVIPMSEQVNDFGDYRSRLVAAIGENNTEVQLARAVVYVTAGTNDFILNYYSILTNRRNMYTVAQYMSFLMELIREFLQGLMDQGVRRILFSGLPPLGCLPISITTYSNSLTNVLVTRSCVAYLNTAAQQFNSMLQSELSTLQNSVNGSKISYIDFYGPVNDTITNPQKYGFVQVNKGCCKTGLFEQGPLCNSVTITCTNSSTYIFWDATHFTDKAYSIIYKANLPIINNIIT